MESGRWEVTFAGDFRADRLKFVELPESVASALEEGAPVYLQGEDGDECVLVCGRDSFALKKVETSNTVYLAVPERAVFGANDEPERRLRIASQSTYSVVLERLREHLERHRFGYGTEVVRDARYELPGLSVVAQCSEPQVREALDDLRALEVEHQWFLPETAFLLEAMSFLIGWLSQQSSPLSSQSVSAVRAALEDYPEAVVNHLLFLLSGVRGPYDSVVSLDARLLVHFKVDILFSSRRRDQMPQAEVLSRLRLELPSDVELRPELLLGSLVSSQKADGPVYQYFPVSRLSLEPERRFRQLFEFKLRWSNQEMEPYLQNMKLHGKTISDVLLQYTKTAIRILPSGERVKELCERSSL